MNELAGKVAIVTGGASGIGRATVDLFVEEGAKVVIADLDTDRGEELAGKFDGVVLFKRTDVSKPEDVDALLNYAIENFGGLHIMFNNAGIGGARYGRFLDDELKDFHRVLEVNLFGVMLGTQRAGRHMAKNGGGSIINTASIAGVLAGYGVITYRASKAGVIQFSKSAAIDLGEYGIRVNCIAPGHIPTEMTTYADPGAPQELVARIRKGVQGVMMKSQPLKRQGMPRDVAQAAVFLGSDRSLQVTGMVIPVDGGIITGDPVNHLEGILAARAKAMAGGD